MTLGRSEYPRSSGYDATWLLSLDMGPNPLWLLEDLLQGSPLRPGMRVLDLGAGKGATSVFLAREFGVSVIAADLWIDPTEAQVMFTDAGVGDRVLALKADARALPFPHDYFDAVISVDAFEYFGTAESYLPYLVKFVKPGGLLAMATPALRSEPRELGGIPAPVFDLVGGEALAWHTAQWWRFQWAATGLVEVTAARLQDRGWQDWLDWARAADAAGHDQAGTIAMLEADAGELLTFALVTATRRRLP